MCVHGVIKLNTRSQILGGGGPFYLCGVITVVGKGKMERDMTGTSVSGSLAVSASPCQLRSVLESRV